MAQVQVGLGAIVGDEDLPMLVGGHGAGVDVDVGVELLEGDAQVAGLQDGPDGRRSNPLANGGNDPAGYEDVLRHRTSILTQKNGVEEGPRTADPLAGAVGRLWSTDSRPTCWCRRQTVAYFAERVSLRTHRQLRNGGVGVDRREHRMVLLPALRLPLPLFGAARPGTGRLLRPGPGQSPAAPRAKLS